MSGKSPLFCVALPRQFFYIHFLDRDFRGKNNKFMFALRQTRFFAFPLRGGVSWLPLPRELLSDSETEGEYFYLYHTFSLFTLSYYFFTPSVTTPSCHLPHLMEARSALAQDLCVGGILCGCFNGLRFGLCRLCRLFNGRIFLRFGRRCNAARHPSRLRRFQGF